MTSRDDYFNPLDISSLADSLAHAFARQPCRPMPPEPIVGAGVYALYYKGALPFYEFVAAPNRKGVCRIPIYVGKAIPEGGRKGGWHFNALHGNALSKRLREHTKSIEEAENLTLGDFAYRYLVVDDIWIPLVENILISHFQPLWNIVVDGFGIHAPGKGRGGQSKSDWDTIHPGRAFAAKLPERKSAESIINRIYAFYQELEKKTGQSQLKFF